MNDDAFFANLQRIDLGNGVAEHDNLLMKCMVETQHFTDLLCDRIDLVLGSKGSGKSSLFRIFGEILEEHLFEKCQTIVVSGVETKGDPIFRSYSEHFQHFSEQQFETFWKAYLLSLVYNKLFHDPRIHAVLAPYNKDILAFRKHYDSLGFIDIGRVNSPTKLLKLVCACTIAAVEGVKIAWDVERNSLELGVNIGEKIRDGYREVVVPHLTTTDTVLCVDALSTLAQASGYKIWMILDHLDVVFRRRSHEETRALRALLRVLYAFTSDNLRLKIFLRDDILDAISSDSQEPLAAVSHITARSGQNLKWTSDSLCVMIMKRFAADPWVSEHFGLQIDRLADVDYCRICIQSMFNFKYKRQQAFDWIYSLLSDGRGVVTPRDLIDLLKTALHLHSLWLQKHPEKREFMTIAAIQQAHKDLSINRRQTVLQTEFSHLMPWIRVLEGNRESYRKEDLLRIFGENGEQAVSTLQAIGILQYNHKKASYRVAKLYGPGLMVYATRARRTAASATPRIE